MKTLKELRNIIANGEPEEKLTAAMEITNFMLPYNEEYNLLLDLEASATIEHFAITHPEKGGIDHGYRLELEALQTSIMARKSFLDMQLHAFQNSEIGIDAPDQDVVDNVKKLTDKVAKIVMKNQAIKGIIASLAEIATLINNTMERLKPA